MLWNEELSDFVRRGGISLGFGISRPKCCGGAEVKDIDLTGPRLSFADMEVLMFLLLCFTLVVVEFEISEFSTIRRAGQESFIAFTLICVVFTLDFSTSS